MDNGGQPSSNDFRALAPFSGNPLTREEYLLNKAKIDDAREKLAKMEMEIELQELARQGREAEQKLAKMRAAVASFPAGPSRSASDSNYYPHPSYQEVPLTARIEEEVQDLPSNVQSSRPSAQVPLTYHDYQRNYPPPSWSSSSLHRRPSTHGRGHTFAVPNYQHSTPSSTPSYTYQKMSQTRQSHQQLGEEYWAQQSQKYMAELAAAGTRPQGETSSAGVNPQATLPSGTAIPQHAQRQTPLPAAPSEVAPAIPSTQRPASSSQVRPSLTGATLLSARPQQARVQHQTILSPAPSEAAPTVPSIQRPPSSSEVQPSLNDQSSSNDATQPALTKQKFIRSFQTVCGHNAVLIRAFLSTYPVSVEWLTEAVSSIDPAKLKDASAVALLNEMRKHFKVSPPQSTSTSTSTNVCVPVVEDPSKASTTTIQPSPSPTDSSSIQQPTSLDTKEKYMVCFHEIYRRAGMDKATDFFLRNQPRVPQEWQQALVNSLTPELSAEMHAAWNRAHRRPGEAHLASSGAAGGSDASSNNIPNNVTQQNRSQTTSPNLNEVVTQSAPTTTDLPNLIPVPPRPSVTRSTQVQSMSAQPSQTSTALHRTTTTMFAASATQSTSAPAARVSAPTVQVSASTTQKAPLAPLTQPTAFTTRQQEPLTRFVAYQHATANQYRPYNIPPPMSVPTVDGKHVYYVYDPYLSKYTRRDIHVADGQAVPSNSSTLSRQHPPTVVPQAISAQVQAVISIPPATPSRRPSETATEGRTPQQADKSRLARDILISLGMDELPVVAAEGEERSEEGAGILDNLPATQETVQSQELAYEPSQVAHGTNRALPTSDVPMEQEQQPSHEAPQDTSLVLPPPSDVSVEQGQQPQAATQATQSPIKAITIDLTMDDETASTTPGKGATSFIFPPPTVAPVPSSTSTNRDELRRGVDEILSPKLPSLTAAPGAASVSMDQDELSRGVDGMSIATDMHRLGPGREDGHMHSGVSFPDVDEPLLPVPIPASSSSPAPSFRAQSFEQNEEVANEVLPLFLPSPSASPVPSAPLPPDTDDEVIVVETMLGGGSSSKRRSYSDVLMSDDELSLTPPRVVRKKGQKAYVLVPPPSPGLRKAIKKRKLGESGIVSGSEEEEESKYNDFERAFMVDCRFRMVERPCQWEGCDALMNSGENLYLHLKLHAQEASSKGLYICRWQSCPQRFKSAAAMEKHLQKHSYFPLPCPIADCPDSFDEPFDAIQHEMRQRQESTVQLGMKQPPDPHVARTPAEMDPLPRIVPSYRTEARHIRHPRITPQRHRVIGPWVLHHIFSPVEQNQRKQNAPMKLRFPRRDAAPEDLDNLRARPDEYDFLASLSTPPTRTVRYDDLDSEGVSLALHEGLTLWDTVSDSDSRPAKSNHEGQGDADPGIDMVIMMETRDEGAPRSVPVEDSMMPDGEISTVDGMYSSQWTTGGAGEEEAVEMMLL